MYCDGTNGTPNLRGRTLIGTGLWNDIYGNITYFLGNTGGERFHKLTISEIPSHNHMSHPWTDYYFYGNTTGLRHGSTDIVSAYGSLPTSYTGGDQPHNNMMPYMAVHWIMKL